MFFLYEYHTFTLCDVQTLHYCSLFSFSCVLLCTTYNEQYAKKNNEYEVRQWSNSYRRLCKSIWIRVSRGLRTMRGLQYPTSGSWFPVTSHTYLRSSLSLHITYIHTYIIHVYKNNLIVHRAQKIQDLCWHERAVSRKKKISFEEDYTFILILRYMINLVLIFVRSIQGVPLRKIMR